MNFKDSIATISRILAIVKDVGMILAAWQIAGHVVK